MNGLPKDYRGRCEILLNDVDCTAVNRNLVVLFVLLSSGLSIEEAAELATHLMYSAALTEAGAAYVKRCTGYIYNSNRDDATSRRSLPTRGEGKIFPPQTAFGRPTEMFRSTYDLATALRSMRSVVFDPARVDDRDRFLVGLKPAHRLALERVRQTGVLAPFSLNTSPFTQPNR